MHSRIERQQALEVAAHRVLASHVIEGSHPATLQPGHNLFVVLRAVQVYLPEMQSAMEAAGIDTRDPDAVWQQFGQEVMSRAEPAEEQQSQVGPLSLGIVIGAVVSLAVSSFVGWLKRRRQRRGAEVDEEAELASDSYQDDESAYAE